MEIGEHINNSHNSLKPNVRTGAAKANCEMCEIISKWAVGIVN